MKRTIVLFLSVFFLSLTASAGLIHNKAEGIVHFVTGESVHYDKISIPNAADASIRAKNAQRKDTIIKAKDIRLLELWKPQQPDAHYFFSYLPCHFPMSFYSHVWSVVVGVGEILSAYKVADSYDITKEGYLFYILNKGIVPSVVFYNAQSEEYLLWGPSTKKQRAQFFAKDPEIAGKISAGELRDSDYQYIIDNYNPQQ